MTARRRRRVRRPERFGPLQALLEMFALYMAGQCAITIWLPHLQIRA